MKLLIVMLFALSFNSFSATEEEKICKKKMKESSDIKTCLEIVKSIKGGVHCRFCPSETIKCIPRPDCKKNLYE